MTALYRLFGKGGHIVSDYICATVTKEETLQEMCE